MAQTRILALRDSAFSSPLPLSVSSGVLQDEEREPEYSLASYQTLGRWIPDPALFRAAYQKLLEVFCWSGAINRRRPDESCIPTPPDKV